MSEATKEIVSVIGEDGKLTDYVKRDKAYGEISELKMHVSNVEASRVQDRADMNRAIGRYTNIVNAVTRVLAKAQPGQNNEWMVSIPDSDMKEIRAMVELHE